MYDFRNAARRSLSQFGTSYGAAPPEITVEKSWVHAAEGYDVELACIVHGGDVTSDVSHMHVNVGKSVRWGWFCLPPLRLRFLMHFMIHYALVVTMCLSASLPSDDVVPELVSPGSIRSPIDGVEG